MVEKNSVIDLFAGCGGFSIGFERAGFRVTKAVEIDSQIAHTYSINHANVIMFNEDIGKIDNKNNFVRGEAEVIIGGPPCQGFSMAGARIRKNGFIEDPRNYLFKHYVNVVKIVRPKVFVFENVKGILSMKNGEIFREIVNTFSNPKNFDGDHYAISYKIAKAVEFGIPEKRERVIIIGVLNKKIDFREVEQTTKNQILQKYPFFFDKVTVGDAITGLPLPTKDGIIKNPHPINQYQEYICSKGETLANHKATTHTTVALKRMHQIKDGQNWTSLEEEIHSVHSGAYGRMSWNEPSATITTRFDTPSGGRFTHPEEDRTITPREAARLQSFPDDFVFYGSKSSICKQIGNAVPPKLSFFIANLINNIIHE